MKHKKVKIGDKFTRLTVEKEIGHLNLYKGECCGYFVSIPM